MKRRTTIKNLRRSSRGRSQIMNPCTAASFQAAIDRARTHGGAAAAMKTAPGRYSVLSANGRDLYHLTVVGDGRDYQCECTAGRNGRACWHSAACYLHILGERMIVPKPVKTLSAREELFG